MQEIKNDGVILGRRPTDFVAGTLPFVERKPNGNWKPYCPYGENQWSNKADSMACATFSALNCLETQEFYFTGVQKNYSDRWIAKMSGTTHEGNYLYKVVDAVREFGLVLESDYPTPASFTFDEYYADIPEPLLSELKAKGKEWLKTHEVAYEWLTVNDWNLDHHLKHAPIQVVIPGHAVEGVNSPNDTMDYFDSYEPYNKNVPVSSLSDALKIVLTIKGDPMKLINDNGTIFLVGEKGKIGFADKDSLDVFMSITDIIENGDTSGLVQKQIIERGFVVHR
jgi:hypothetical protein